MAHWLRNIKLAELSLVDRPANRGARATIFKRENAEKRWSEAAIQASIEARRRKRKGKHSTGYKGKIIGGRAADSILLDPQTVHIGHSDSPTYYHPAHGAFRVHKESEDLAVKDLTVICKKDYDQKTRDEMASNGEAMSGGRYPIEDKGDLEDAIHAIGRGKGSHADIRAHIRRRAKALGAEDLLPEDWTKGDDDMTLEEQLRKLQEDITKATSDLAIEKAARLQAEAFAKMTDAEKDHCVGMSDDQKKAFMAKSPDDRKTEMNKRAADDELITVAGVTVKKSAVGDGVFAIMKAQQVRIDKADEDIRKAREREERQQLVKRAKEELPNLPGSDEEKADLLKAVEAIPDEKGRKAAMEALKAGSNALRERTGELGHGRPRLITKAAEQLDDLAKDYAEKNKVTHAAAYEAVLKTAKGRELYAQSENEKAA